MQTNEFKNNVKSAAQYLERAGINVPHTQLLEAISNAFGERNWSTMRALLANPPQPGALAQVGESLDAEIVDWSPAKGSMPEGLFSHKGGDCCPACGEVDVEADGIQVDGSEAWEENTCLNPLCQATWTTNYSISGYSSLKVGTGWRLRGTVVRPDVVESLVEHVMDQAKKYEFSVDSRAAAIELVGESDNLLDLEASAAEIEKAAQELMD